MAGESVSLKKQGQCVVEKVKAACARRGANGIRGLQRCFRIMDDNHSLTLSPEELASGLMDYGIVLSKQEQKQLAAAFDRNGDGLVSINEFLATVRGGLKGRRLEVVREAFAKFDRDGSGKIDVADLHGVYDASRHPKVLSGEQTEEEVLESMLATFDSQTNPDGVVTRDEFEAYYAGLSASIDSDDYFELMMRNTWKLDEPLPPPKSEWDTTGRSPQSPPSPTVRASAAASRNVARSLTSLDGVNEKQLPPAPPRRIVGYTGHVPGAQETFGEGFTRVAERSQEASEAARKKPPLPLPPFKDEARAFARKGNAANQHSFRLE
eukprot:TRINITY_DN50683_c0_g1_i1.p1 TRINITY_DN50683_c0_g1~~TRINITY_DN50683_c0_g1_i1.p1  ORF type:complete len:352 (+),score=129.41 TRINITY_DN50683_c0_g1_i1:88-1056(+)